MTFSVGFKYSSACSPFDLGQISVVVLCLLGLVVGFGTSPATKKLEGISAAPGAGARLRDGSSSWRGVLFYVWKSGSVLEEVYKRRDTRTHAV